MMKAREDDRRIFQRVEDGEVTLNVYSLQSTEHLDIHKLWNALDLEGKHQSGTTAGLFDEVVQPSDFAYSEQSDITIPAQAGIYADYYQLLQILKTAFLQAKTLGSLIHIDNHHLQKLIALKELLQAKEKGSDPAAKQAASEALPIINQSILIAQRYDSVVANPPYMGSKGMNVDLKNYAKKEFPNSKADLFAIFMERAFSLLTKSGFNAQINMQSWMFLSSYEELRKCLLDSNTIITMAHLGPRAFGQISGEVVQTTAWIFKNLQAAHYKPTFFRLVNGNESEKQEKLLNKFSRFEELKQSDFSQMEGSPISYWLEESVIDLCKKAVKVGDLAKVRKGLVTLDDARFIRHWHEVSFKNIKYKFKSHDNIEAVKETWFPINKGGGSRRWYGFTGNIINWKDNGKELKNFIVEKYNGGSYTKEIRSENFYFKPSITWASISTNSCSFRYCKDGFIFSSGGSCLFPSSEIPIDKLLGVLNSNFIDNLLKSLTPTMNFVAGDIARMPVPDFSMVNESVVRKLIGLSEYDWSLNEENHEFKKSVLLKRKDSRIIDSFNYASNERENILEDFRRLEKENEQQVQKAFGLDLPIGHNTLSLHSDLEYRYGYNDLNRYQSDSLVELLSFSLGCMMGRYSPDSEGLIYAHSGNEGFKELVAKGLYNTFPADDDGIIPLASEEWLFDDDATTRFKEFVKTVWGDEHLTENLEFVAESLCLHALKPLSTKKGSSESAMDTIRRYFSTQFFKDHCKTYKKRPIYWLFSSGKEKAFECLVYLHRYNEGTLSRMRTEYVTPLMGKYEAQHTLLSEQQLQATGTEARGIEKDLKSLEKKQAELRAFDEQLKHYAEMRITLDLDDGVKANYGKFGNLLADVKAIHGKAVK